MQSRSQFELSTSSPSRARNRARALGRGTGVAFTLMLIAGCGSSPDVVLDSDGSSGPSGNLDPSASQTDPSEVATPAPDFDLQRIQEPGLLRPSGVREAVVARTRSIAGRLDAETRKSLMQLGRIQHTFSNGRVLEFYNSTAGNFGTGDEILGRTDELADYIERVENAPEGPVTHLRSLASDDDDDTWPGNVIPYEYDSSVTSAQRSAVEESVRLWNLDNPVVKYRPSNGSGDRVTFNTVDTTEFCGRSPVGRSFAIGGQDVEIDDGCFDPHTLLHEMAHSAGLHHEQQRCGRNAYVSIHNNSNGDGPRGTDYDELCGDSRNYGDYDYASLMHYPPLPGPDRDFMTILNGPDPMMGLPSVAGQMNRLSQDDVNAISWYHTKKTYSTTSGFGFAWASQATGSFQASSSYAANSAGAVPTISQVKSLFGFGSPITGRYRVSFPNVGSEVGGNVQVTAYGSDPGRCKVEGWASNGTTLDVGVRCMDMAGNLVNRLFAVSYQRIPSPSTGLQGGYLYSQRINEPGAYTPDPYYSWNSAGQRNRVTRVVQGQYTVQFPGITVTGGTVRVTAYGANNDYCNVASWGSRSVDVRCYDSAGNPKDSAFSVAFTDSGFTGTFAYVWEDNATRTDRYAPNSLYQKAKIRTRSGSVPASIMSTRNNTGDYTLELPGVAPFSSNVHVTSYGSGNNNTCQVASWFPGTSVGPNLEDRRENVNVRCFNPSGGAADSRFALTYTTNE